jgi:hypothetical protein
MLAPVVAWARQGFPPVRVRFGAPVSAGDDQADRGDDERGEGQTGDERER